LGMVGGQAHINGVRKPFPDNLDYNP
jgi:hypothetical protein